MWHFGGHHFWGMHWIWWIVGVIILIWIFVIPRDIPGQRSKKERPLDIAKRRYASGEITAEEYEDIKKRLEGK